MRYFPLLLCLCACHRSILLGEGPTGPCADGTWSGWTDPEGLTHVALDGNDVAGDGSIEHPFLTLGRAVAARRRSAEVAGTELRVALGPGAFLANVELSAGVSDSLAVQGCGVGETTLQGVAAPGWGDEAVVVEGVRPVAIRRVSITSTGPGVIGRKGTDVTLESVQISGASHFAVSSIGTSRITLRDVVIDGLGVGGRGHGLLGWGILVTGADALLERVTIRGAVSIGVYQKGGHLVAKDLTVDGVAGTGLDRRGFGLQIQEAEGAHIDGCTVSNVLGGGILVVNTAQASIRGCVVSGVAGGADPGDGIVVARRGQPSLPLVELTDNTVHGAARMGIVLAGVDATLSGNVAGPDNGQVVDGASIYADADTRVEGAAVASFDRSVLRILRAGGRDPTQAGRRSP